MLPNRRRSTRRTGRSPTGGRGAAEAWHPPSAGLRLAPAHTSRAAVRTAIRHTIASTKQNKPPLNSIRPRRRTAPEGCAFGVDWNRSARYNNSMGAIQLTDDELRILQDHRKGAPHKLMRLKSEAIIMLSMGASRKFAAEFVERSTETIKRWVRQWNESGLESIRTGHAGNDNASKLTREQAEETREALSRPPSEQGIPADFWDVPRLAGWMHEHFDVEYRSRSSYHRRFRMAELSFHKPVGVDRHRAPEAEIEARMEQIHAEIARIAGRRRDGREEDEGRRETGKRADGEGKECEDVMVVSADEVGIEHEAVIRRAWCKKCAKTRIRVDRERQSQKYIGFLHESDGRVDLMRLERCNTDSVVKALTELTLKYPDKTIVVVWDNAGWHKSSTLLAQTEKGKPLERIQSINLPPYSPDKNPVEKVWNEGKNSISNRQRAFFEDTCEAFESFVTSKKFKYRLFRSSR